MGKIDSIKLLPPLQSCDEQYIQNRFDLKHEKYFHIEVTANNHRYWIPVYRKYFKCYLGVYLKDYPFDLDDLFKWIFSKFWFIRKIYFSNLINKVEDIDPGRVFLINLKHGFKKYEDNLSKKLLSNLRYYKKKLDEKFNLSLIACSEIPLEYVSQYLLWKKASHDFSYSKGEKQFLDDYSINYCYCLVSQATGSVIAILFLNRYGKNIFLENFSYDPDYQKYSPGKVLLYEVIQRLFDEDLESFILGGGPEDSYKSSFSNELIETYTGSISRKSKLSKPFS